MKNTGKLGIKWLIMKAVIITLIIFFLNQTYAQEITPEVITTHPQEITPNILEQTERFYEISEKSLKVGYNTTLDANSAFQLTVEQQERYIIVNNFSENKVSLIFIRKGETLFNQPLETGNYVIFKLGDLRLQLTLHSANKTHAQVELNLFEEEIPEDVDYFELFDIKVQLAKDVIYRPADLAAIIEFTNFGEGPSHIRVVYSVIDTNEKEMYTGIDEKIVETNEVLIKNFRNLDIPHGDYLVRTTIYYGDDQKAMSEKAFSLKKVPTSQIIKQPLLFIGMIIVFFAAVIFFKKRKDTQANLY